MRVASVSLRLALAAVALGVLCGWKFTLDGPLQRTRAKLEKQHQVVESYRQAYGRLPTPQEFFAYKATLFPDKATRLSMSTDGWDRCMWFELRGDTFIVLSEGPNGIYDGGGVDDVSLEIER